MPWSQKAGRGSRESAAKKLIDQGLKEVMVVCTAAKGGKDLSQILYRVLRIRRSTEKKVAYISCKLSDGR